MFSIISMILILAGCASDSAENGQASAASSESGFEVREGVQPPENKSQVLTLNLEDQTVKPGETVCANVQVRNFRNIMSMQYTTRWDPAVLRFTKVQGFSLKDLSATNFGTTRAEEGQIAISWFDQDLKSITLPDDNTIYQICFEAIGASGSSSSLQFTGDPVIIEISNLAGEIIGFSSRKARINIQ